MATDARATIADYMVRSLYSSYATDTLQEMIAIGEKLLAEGSADEIEARHLNAALQREIERRKEDAL